MDKMLVPHNGQKDSWNDLEGFKTVWKSLGEFKEVLHKITTEFEFFHFQDEAIKHHDIRKLVSDKLSQIATSRRNSFTGRLYIYKIPDFKREKHDARTLLAKILASAEKTLTTKEQKILPPFEQLKKVVETDAPFNFASQLAPNSLNARCSINFHKYEKCPTSRELSFEYHGPAVFFESMDCGLHPLCNTHPTIRELRDYQRILLIAQKKVEKIIRLLKKQLKQLISIDWRKLIRSIIISPHVHTNDGKEGDDDNFENNSCSKFYYFTISPYDIWIRRLSKNYSTVCNRGLLNWPETSVLHGN